MEAANGDYSLLTKRIYADAILSGAKVYEARKASSIRSLRIGHILAFHWCSGSRVLCEVEGMDEFENAEGMVKALGHRALGFENEADCMAPRYS